MLKLTIHALFSGVTIGILATQALIASCATRVLARLQNSLVALNVMSVITHLPVGRFENGC